MVRTKLNRLTAMLLSFIMILSSFSALTAVETEAATDKITLELNDTNIKWAKTVTFYEPFSKKNYTHWQGQMRHTLRIKETGKVAYCIQPGTYMYDFVQQVRPTLSVGEADAWDALGDEKKSAIKLVMHFGYPNKNIRLSGSAAEQEIATQLIIWEIVCGYRDPNNYSLTDPRFAQGMFGNNYTQNPGVYSPYNQIIDAMIGYNRIMSFANKNMSQANAYTMNWDGTKYSLTLTDKNSVLGKYTLTCTNPDVKLNVSGNQLTATSASPISGSVIVKAKTAISSESNNVIAYGHYSKEIQEVIDQSTSDLPDPVYAYFNLKTQATGSLKVAKQFKSIDGADLAMVEPELLNNTKFKIQNSAGKYIKASYPGSGTVYSYSGYVSSASDGTDFTAKKSGSSFLFEVNKLPVGTYTVTEQDTSLTGFSARGSRSVKVSVTANNSGGIKTVSFENQPNQLVINKIFRKYGAVTDDDYKDISVEVTQNNSAVPIKAVCIDTSNNIYQYVSQPKDSIYSGKVITDQLIFYNPKVHSITLIGLPVKNSSGAYCQYTAKEIDKGRVSGEPPHPYLVLETNSIPTDNIFPKLIRDRQLAGKTISKRYSFNTVTKTFQTGSVQSDNITNTERNIGYLEIEKDFEIENTDGSRSEFTGNYKLTLTEAYGDISFLVKNSAGKYLKANFIGNQYSYLSFVGTASEATKFTFYAGSKTKIRIIGLPFGTYYVIEVIGSRVKGQGFRAENAGQKVTVTWYNASTDSVVGGHTGFVNVKPQYVGLRIYKNFTDTDGESIDAESLRPYVSFGNNFNSEAPTGFVRTEKVYPFRIIDNGVTVEVNDDGSIGIPNDPIEGSIRVVKRDKIADIPVEGAEFTLYDSKGKIVKKVTTDKDGIADFGKVLYGKYTVRETTAPKHYVLDDTPIPFEILEHTKTYGYTQKETPKPGYGRLKKTSEDGIVEGFNFRIYGVSDSGVKYNDTLLTDKKGEIRVELLPGNYTVEEVETPDRYIQPKKQKIRIESGKTTSIKFENRLKKGNIEVIKVDKITRKPLAGAEFTLYDSSDHEVMKLVTDENGRVFFENIPYGDYYLVETKFPDDYVPDSTTVPFSVVEDGLLIAFEKENTPDSGNLEIIKESEDGVIENIGFHIYGTAKNGVEINETVHTDKEGKFIIENLLVGTYTVEETEQPDRYIRQEPQIVEVRANETAVVRFENKLKHGSVTVTKVDEEYPDHKLSGAVFEIFDMDYNSIGSMTEIEAGVYRLDGLTFGKYILKEIEAPKYYELDPNEYPFEIVEDGDVRVIETLAGTGFINKPQKGSLVITKRSSDGKLEGFSFRVTGKAFTGQDYYETFTTDKDGRIVVEGLRVGEYTVSEIADESNARYIFPDDETVLIPANNAAEMEMINDEKVIPFELTKKDISTGELIPDCGIEILDENKKVIFRDRTDKNGIITFEKLPYGKYFYREFDTPEGYKIDETPYPFEIKENGRIIRAVMTNKPVEKKPGYITTDTPKNTGKVTTPQTGDDSNTMAAVIAIICLISVSAIYFCRSRKKDDKN